MSKMIDFWRLLLLLLPSEHNHTEARIQVSIAQDPLTTDRCPHFFFRMEKENVHGRWRS